MTVAECLQLNVVPIHESHQSNDNLPSATDLEQEIMHRLVPSINAVYMIAQMMEEKSLGPVDLGPYQQYIHDLKECALNQDAFTHCLLRYLRNNNNK